MLLNYPKVTTKVYKRCLPIINMNERNEEIISTLNFYKDKNVPIHLTLIADTWLNGKVISVSADRFVLQEEKLGEMLIFFDRIKDDGIVPRNEK